MLAGDELERSMRLPARAAPLTVEEVAAARDNPGLKRA